MSLNDELLEIFRKERKYASFFECPDKASKEIMIVEKLLESMGYLESRYVKNLRPAKNDPPDILGEINGLTVGFEVTELVDEETTKLNAQGHIVWRKWKRDEVLEKIQNIIKIKDSKTYHGGPYEKLYLVIHSDEPRIYPRVFTDIIQKYRFIKPENITDICLIFSYDPSTKNYPLVKLTFEN